MKQNINKTINKYYAFMLLRDMTFFSAVLVPFFTDWGGINLRQVQTLQSWFMFWMFVMEVPTGAVADWLGRKFSIMLGGAMVALAALVYGSMPSFAVFLVAEFLFATAGALQSGADKALIFDSLKQAGQEKRAKDVFGKANSIKLIALLVSAPIGSFVAGKWGLNMPMILTAVPFLLASVAISTVKEPKVADKISESVRFWQMAKGGWLFFLKHKNLRLLALDSMVVGISAYFVIWMYQPLLKNIGVPIEYFGWIHALMVGSEMLVSANFVRLEKLVGGGKKLLRATALITGLAFLMVAINANLVTVLLLVVLAGGFGLTRRELISAYMNKYIESGQRATVLSSISMFARLSLAIANPIIGSLADWSLPATLVILGLIPLTVFLFSPVEQEAFEK